VFDRIGKLEKACSRYRQLPLFARLADCYLKRGKVDRALALCRKGCENFPTYATGHSVLSSCYRDKGDLEEARTALDRALRLDPENPKGFVRLSGLYREMGIVTLALKSMQQAAVLDPFSEEIASQLERLQRELPSSSPDAEPSVKTAGKTAGKTADPLSVGDEIPADPLAAADAMRETVDLPVGSQELSTRERSHEGPDTGEGVPPPPGGTAPAGLVELGEGLFDGTPTDLETTLKPGDAASDEESGQHTLEAPGTPAVSEERKPDDEPFAQVQPLAEWDDQALPTAAGESDELRSGSEGEPVENPDVSSAVNRGMDQEVAGLGADLFADDIEDNDLPTAGTPSSIEAETSVPVGSVTGAGDPDLPAIRDAAEPAESQPSDPAEAAPPEDLVPAAADLTQSEIPVPAAADRTPLADLVPLEELVPLEYLMPVEDPTPAEDASSMGGAPPLEDLVPLEDLTQLTDLIPADLLNPAGTDDLVESTKLIPADLVNPVEQDQPADLASPVEQDQPADLASLVEQDQPADLASPIEQDQPADLASPIEQDERTDSTKSVSEVSVGVAGSATLGEFAIADPPAGDPGDSPVLNRRRDVPELPDLSVSRFSRGDDGKLLDLFRQIEQPVVTKPEEKAAAEPEAIDEQPSDHADLVEQFAAMTSAEQRPLRRFDDVAISSPAPLPDVDQVEPIATVTLAQLYAGQGFPDRAANTYRRILTDEPESDDIKLKLAALEQTPTLP